MSQDQAELYQQVINNMAAKLAQSEVTSAEWQARAEAAEAQLGQHVREADGPRDQAV